MNYDTKLMAVLNVTPDSFSDGGRFLNPELAVEHGLKLASEGAGIIDVGGESTRPGSERVSVQEQIGRIEPVVATLRARLDESGFANVAISIDTTRASVAEMALDHGASLINDISAGEDDPEILDLAAERDVDICLMHKQGAPKAMQHDPSYENVVGEVLEYLEQRLAIATQKGISPKRCLLDPGIGFGKSFEDNHALIRSLSAIKSKGYRVLLGVSRKRFLAHLTGQVLETVDNQHLDIASTAIALMTIDHVDVLRVHNVLLHKMMLHIYTQVNNT